MMWELRVGLRVARNAQGNVVGQVFLSDAFENGAGYCSQFATPATSSVSKAALFAMIREHRRASDA